MNETKESQENFTEIFKETAGGGVNGVSAGHLTQLRS